MCFGQEYSSVVYISVNGNSQLGTAANPTSFNYAVDFIFPKLNNVSTLVAIEVGSYNYTGQLVLPSNVMLDG